MVIRGHFNNLLHSFFQKEITQQGLTKPYPLGLRKSWRLCKDQNLDHCLTTCKVLSFQDIYNVPTLYANDAVLVSFGNSLEDLLDKVNKKFQEVYQAVPKCQQVKFILFTNKNVLNFSHLSIGSIIISLVKYVQYMRVHIDDNLKFIVQPGNLKTRLR